MKIKSTINVSTLTIFFGFLLLSLLSIGQQADNCKDIIPLGFYDKTNISNTGEFSQDVKNWLKSDNFKEFVSKQDGDFGLKIPIGGLNIGFGAGSSSEQYQKLRDYLSTSNSNVVNSSFANIVSQQIVDKAVVEAWSKCISEKNQNLIGLIGEIEGKGEDFIVLRLRWFPRLGINQISISPIFVAGGEYPRDIVNFPYLLGTEWLSIPIQRTGKSKVTMVINSTVGLGSFSYIDDPKVEEKVIVVSEKKSDVIVIQPKEGCFKGDMSACIKFMDQINADCKLSPSLDCMSKGQFLNNYITSYQTTEKVCNDYGQLSKACQQSRTRTYEIKTSFWDRLF